METPASKKRLRSTLSAEGLDRCGMPSTPSAKRPLLSARSNNEINRAGTSTPQPNFTFATPRPPSSFATPPCSRKRCLSAQSPARSEPPRQQFKATPIDKRIFDPKCAMGVPRSTKKPPTQIKPFSDRFEKANQELLERRRQLQESGEHAKDKK